jgi:hypothetical protein
VGCAAVSEILGVEVVWEIYKGVAEFNLSSLLETLLAPKTYDAFLKLERLLPAEQRDFDEVRGELERDLRVRVSEAAMRELHDKLFRKATIDVRDPAIRPAFERKHGRR